MCLAVALGFCGASQMCGRRAIECGRLSSDRRLFSAAAHGGFTPTHHYRGVHGKAGLYDCPERSLSNCPPLLPQIGCRADHTGMLLSCMSCAFEPQAVLRLLPTFPKDRRSGSAPPQALPRQPRQRSEAVCIPHAFATGAGPGAAPCKRPLRSYLRSCGQPVFYHFVL